ncbi:MAG: TetR/AcrR family transcriptional regulator [Solirubrobacteraceae bacterium]
MSDAEGQSSVRQTRRQERKQQTRGELIAAAGRVFARRGFHGASIERIAKEAGYSIGAVYWHFKDKDDLFLAVYEAQAAARVRDLEEFRERAAGELPQRARAYADQFMRRLDEDPEFTILTLEFLVHAWRNPALREAFGHRIAWGRLAVARILQQDAREGGYRLPMPAEDLAIILRELGTGLGLARLADPGAIPGRIFGDFVETLFELMRPTQHELDTAVGGSARDTDPAVGGSARDTDPAVGGSAR